MEIEEIYLKYKLHMFCIANNILNNYHLSEDAVQIAFIKIFENHKKIKDKKEKEIKAYISVVVANVAKTLYSINKKEQIKIEKIKGRYISDSERINKLQQRDRYLINLKYNFDLKNRDIAKLLNMDEKLVSKKIRKIEKSIGKEDL